MVSPFERFINSTYMSQRESIESFFFYDSDKKFWFKILKSTCVFISFDYAFGVRWIRKHHEIIDVKRCNKKQSDHLMHCHNYEFRKLQA